MAAGLGFKEFLTGDVLTAADANGFLASQVVMVFASAAARASAITSPQEGMITYLKDTDQVQTFSGSSYVTVGGSPLTTKGDLYTFSTVDARLAVGANGTVLTADSAEATGLKWATPAGGLTLILAQTIGTGVSSVNVTSAFSATFANYKILVSGGVGSADAQFALKLGTTTTGYFGFIISGSYSASTVTGGNFSNTANFQGAGIVTTNSISCDFDLQNPNAAKNTHYKSAWAQSNTAGTANTVQGFLNNTTQYTDFTLTPGSGTLTGGTIRVYGYQNS